MSIKNKIADFFGFEKKSYYQSMLSPSFETLGDLLNVGQNDLSKYRSVIEQINAYEFLSIPYRVINDTAARVVDFPILLFKGKNKIDSHYVIDMMRFPNDSGQSFDQIRFESMCFYLITGNSYLYVPRGAGTREPIGTMWVRYPQYTQPEIENRKIIYRYNGNDHLLPGPQGGMIIQREEMIHHKTFNPMSQIVGISPLQHAASSLEMQKESMDWNVKTIKRALKIPGIISYKRIVPDESEAEQLRESFWSRFKKRPGEPFIAFGEMNYTPIEFKSNDIDFIEARKMDTRDLCGIYGYPYKLAIPNDASSLSENEMSSMIEQWYNGVIVPLVKQECKLYNSFFFPNGDYEFRPDYMAVPQYRDIVAGNLKALDAIVSITPNEKRRMAGLEELAIPEADKLYMPSGYMPIDELGLSIPEDQEDRESL